MSGIQAESNQLPSAAAASSSNGRQRKRSDNSPSLLDAGTFSLLLAGDSATQNQPFQKVKSSYHSFTESRPVERRTDNEDRSTAETLRHEESVERPRTEREKVGESTSNGRVDNEQANAETAVETATEAEEPLENEADSESPSQISVALAKQVVDAETTEEVVEAILPIDELDDQDQEGHQDPVVSGLDEEVVDELAIDIGAEKDSSATTVVKKNELNAAVQADQEEVATAATPVVDIDEQGESDGSRDRDGKVTTQSLVTQNDSAKNTKNEKGTVETQVVSVQSDEKNAASDGSVKVGATQIEEATEEVQVETTPTQTKRETAPKPTAEPEGEAISASLSSPGDSPEKAARSTQNNDAQPLQSTVASPAANSSQQRIQHNLLPRTTSADGGAGRVSVDSAKFLPRVAKAFSAAAQRGGEIRIRLSPPELGSIRLEVKMQGGHMTAKLDAETPAARQALADNLPLLRERLAEQGLRIEQLDIGTLDRQDRETFDAHEQEQRDQAGNSRQDDERFVEAEEEANSGGLRIGSTSLDVVA